MEVDTEWTNHVLKQMDRLRKEGYHDVIIYVGEKQFPCHRHLMAALCPTLKPMLLDENWRYEEPSLSGVDADLFEMIVEYAYTGIIDITRLNALRLLKAADYLNIDRLMKSCITCLKQSCRTNDLLDAYEFANHLKERDFIISLETKIGQEMDLLQSEANFLSLTFTSIESILNRMKQLIDSEGDHFVYCCETCISSATLEGNCKICGKQFDYLYSYKACNWLAILAWIKNDVVQRIDHFLVLSKYAKSSEDFYQQFKDLFALYRTEVNKLHQNEVEVIREKLLTHTLVDEKLETLKVNQRNVWSTFSKSPSSIRGGVKAVCKKREIFYLSYDTSENENQFWIEKDELEFLRSPPSVVHDFQMTSAKDVIYLYNYSKNYSSNFDTDPANTEVVNIFAYVEGKDKWYLESCPSKQLYHSYFVSAKNTLYLIGGSADFASTYPSEKSVQRYDPRTSKWDLILPDDETDLLLNGGACVYDDKIYIHSKIESIGDNVENEKCRLRFYTFDTRVNKWQTEDRMLDSQFEPTVLIPFENRLWAFSRNPKHGYMIYDVDKNVWSEPETLLGEFQSTGDRIILGANVLNKF